MPVALRHPGVYIEELPSGVRTITGVGTSITAFAGWSPQGPTDRAYLVLSWADYERRFGGLHADSALSYGVLHFFANGGQQAYIVRLVEYGVAKEASVTIDGKLTLRARGEGDWGKSYAVSTQRRAAPDATRFRLVVYRTVKNSDGSETTTPVETFENLSLDANDRRSVAAVIKDESAILLAEVMGTPTDAPADQTEPVDPANPTGPTRPKRNKLDGSVEGKVLKPDTAEFEAALDPSGNADAKFKQRGMYLLNRVDLFNLLVVPGESTAAMLGKLQAFCKDRRAFHIADSAPGATFDTLQSGPDGTLTTATATNGALYFPYIIAPDPLQENRPRAFPPSGAVAGVYARTDATRGVWKAPAGTEASLVGVTGVQAPLTDSENGELNPRAINSLRNFPVYGTIVWGARTLHGNDERGSEWKYVPVRRTALFIEESLYRALKWVVFEPNDEPLWAQVRLNVAVFMHNLFRQGAFQGKTPQEAYLVKCDKDTTTQADINLGIVNILVGFAPLKPAEFVIVKIQQLAGQLAV
jgi:uncharacterized protein